MSNEGRKGHEPTRAPDLVNSEAALRRAALRARTGAALCGLCRGIPRR